MSVRIDIPDAIAVSARAMAQDCGVAPEQLIIQALRAHFPPLEPELQAEFEAWERASDEDTGLEAPEWSAEP